MKAAQDLAAQRWKGKTKAQKKETGEALTEARKAISPERRSAIAKKAAAARWGTKKKKAKKS